MSSNNKGTNDTITPLIKKMYPYVILMNIPVWLISLLWGFELSMIVGLVVGTVYCILAYIYLGKTINYAVNFGEIKAKRLMLSCYIIRFIGLGILGFLALKFSFMNFFGVLIPQFYPRIVLTFMGFSKKNKF